jgi:hypothetical protein
MHAAASRKYATGTGGSGRSGARRFRGSRGGRFSGHRRQSCSQRPRRAAHLAGELVERERTSAGERRAVAARREATVDEAKPSQHADVRESARRAARPFGELRSTRAPHAAPRALLTVAARAPARASQIERYRAAHGRGEHIHAAFHVQVSRATFHALHCNDDLPHLPTSARATDRERPPASTEPLARDVYSRALSPRPAPPVDVGLHRRSLSQRRRRNQVRALRWK